MTSRQLVRVVKRLLLPAIILGFGAAAVLVWLRPTPVSVAPAAVREITPAIQGVGTVEAKVTEALAGAEELRNAEAQRQAAREEIAVLRATLETVTQDIRVAEAALATAAAREGDTVLRSVLDGTVISRDLEPGATASPGASILRIADPQSVWATVHVDERETGKIRIGDPADIALRSLPGRTLRGQVVRIRRESDRVTEQLAVDIAFEDRPPRIILGEQAEATIRPAGVAGAVAVPLSALVRTAQGAGVLTVRDGRLANPGAEGQRVRVTNPPGTEPAA